MVKISHNIIFDITNKVNLALYIVTLMRIKLLIHYAYYANNYFNINITFSKEETVCVSIVVRVCARAKRGEESSYRIILCI